MIRSKPMRGQIKIIALAVFGLAMASPDARAQAFPVLPQKFAVQDGEKTANNAEYAVTVSANYALSRISLSQKDHTSGSILSWRDIYLQGAHINVEFNKAPFIFNKTTIDAGFHKSFHGYHTDDDANNYANVIYSTSTEAALLDVKYEILLENNMFNPKLGLDFTYLKLENYDAKPFMSSNLPSREIEGLVNKYDFYKFGWYGGMQMKIAAGIFYMNLSGQIGSSVYLTLADWILRLDFKHPVSFYTIGLSFRGGGDLETGLRLGRFTIFTRTLLFYEISPIGIETQNHSNGDTPMQFISVDLFRAAFNIGLKVSF